MRKGKSMDERYSGLSEYNGAQITLKPVADSLRCSAEAPLPALVATAELLACSGVPHALQTSSEISPNLGAVAALLEGTAEEISARSRAIPEIAGLVAAFGRLHHATLCGELRDRPTIASFDDLSRFALNRLRGCDVEKVLVLLLDRKSGLIYEHPVQSNMIMHVQFYPREVVLMALLYGASAVILVHNHPTGDPTPSRADIEMSRMVSNALISVGIAFHEHLIVGAKKVAGIRAMRLL
jgi:DNA repair protein RadC